MIWLAHLVPIVAIIALVTAALKTDEPKALPKEFLKAAAPLAGLFVGLAVLALICGRLL